jgi:serine/threonine protein kinase
LHSLNHLNDPHIVKFVAGLKRARSTGSHDHYLIFEWADGGNLRDRWQKHPEPQLTEELLKDTVRQFYGLSNALRKVHESDKAHYRHGDLKPENILWFNDNDGFGTLKIGDWGLAKKHNLATRLRTNKTVTKHGTLRYEPPEAEGNKRSRLYDIWAIGCVMLEHIIWMLYGWEGIVKFTRSVKGDGSVEVPFYELDTDKGLEEGDSNRYRVHPVVVDWMNHLAKESACRKDTALGDMLELVRKDLLVVQLSKWGGSFNDSDPSTLAVSLHSESSTASTNIILTVAPTDEDPSPPPPPPPAMIPGIKVQRAEQARPGPTPMQGRFRIRADLFCEKMRDITGDGIQQDRPGYWRVPRGARRPPAQYSKAASGDDDRLSTDSAKRRQLNGEAWAANLKNDASPFANGGLSAPVRGDKRVRCGSLLPTLSFLFRWLQLRLYPIQCFAPRS